VTVLQQTLSPPRLRSTERGTWIAYGCLGAAILALLLVFHAEAASAVAVWVSSTAYNHCFLVVPIVVYLLWDRRAELAGFAPQPAPAFALLALPLSLAWLVAERVGIMEGRQLVAMTGLQVLFLAVLGPRSYWRVSGPLLYLYFLVPFGAFLTPELQRFTAAFVMHGLDLFGIPNYTDGLTIQIPEGTFIIAEACAGLRFLIAAAAFGCLYALLIYRSPWRRAAFIAVSVIVPIIANGLRALGIVSLGHILGSAQAAETDHILYGWIFFSMVLLLLIVLGLPFREDARRPSAEADAAARPLLDPTAPRRAALTAGAVVLLLCVGPALAHAFDRLQQAPAAGIAFNLQSPCIAAETKPTVPASGRGARPAAAAYRCAGELLVVRTVVFGSRMPPGPILTERAHLGDLQVEDVAARPVIAGGLRWLLAVGTKPPALAASLLWADGHQVEPGLGFRLRRAWTSVVGGGAPVVLVAVAPETLAASDDQAARRRQQEALRTFLTSEPGIKSALAAAAPSRE